MNPVQLGWPTLDQSQASSRCSQRAQPIRFAGLFDAVMIQWYKHNYRQTAQFKFTDNQVALIPENAQYEKAVMALIDGAKESLKIDMYYLGGPLGERIFRRLNERANQDGLKVFYRGDGTDGQENSPQVIPLRTRLRNLVKQAGKRVQSFFYVEHTRRDPLRLLGANHNKLILADNHTALVTTKNPCQNDLDNRDVTMIFRGPVVKSLSKTFNASWERQTGHILKLAHDPAKVWALPDWIQSRMVKQSCRSVITNNDRRQALAVIGEMIDKAHKSIAVEAFCLSNRDIRNRLMKRANEGIRVRVLLDSSESKRFRYVNLVAFKELLQFQKTCPHLEVKAFLHPNIQNQSSPTKTQYDLWRNHNKMLLVDEQWALAGTTNFSNADVWHQENTSVQFEGGPITQKLHTLFEQDWKTHGVSVRPLTKAEHVAAFFIRWLFEF